MAESKYGKYIVKGSIGRKRPPIKLHTSPKVGVEGELWPGVSGLKCNFAFGTISDPLVIPGFPHTHPFDELLFFIGGNPTDPLDFQAEVHIALGEEWEKHVITTAAIVCIPAGLMHSPIMVMKVDKPFIFGHVMLGSTYDTSANPNKVYLYDG